MKVTLINVGIGVAGFNGNRPLGDREGSWIGHGIASIGASIKQAGYATDLIDLRQLFGWGALEDRIKAKPADAYVLSVSAVDHHQALKTVLTIRQQSPKSRVIVGGIHPTIFPQLYDFGAIDSVIQGEGEITAVKLLRAIEHGESLPRIVWGEKPDLDALPWVDRELFDYRRELSCNFAPDQKTPAITMLAGRGCPYQCTYCQPAERAVFGHPYRMRSPGNVVAEMEHLYERHRYKSVTFWDDTFTFRAKWVREFCDLYEKAGIGASIAACSRADIICRNEGMIERLAEVGLDWFVIGLESGSQRILDLIKKGVTVEQNIEAARICRKYGIKVFGTYMYGLPTETNEEALATARMIDEIAPEHPSPFWFTPIKGTDIHTFCEANGLILPETASRTIERTGTYRPTIKGVDYDYISRLMNGERP